MQNLNIGAYALTKIIDLVYFFGVVFALFLIVALFDILTGGLITKRMRNADVGPPAAHIPDAPEEPIPAPFKKPSTQGGAVVSSTTYEF